MPPDDTRGRRAAAAHWGRLRAVRTGSSTDARPRVTALAAVATLAVAALVAPGVARAQESEAVKLVVAIDDRGAQLLQDPAIELDLPGFEKQRMIDNGTLVGDEAGDRIWMFVTPVEGRNSVSLRLYNGEEVLHAMDVAVPKGERAFYAYKMRPDGSLVVDPGARPVEGVGDTVGEGGTLVIQAAPVEGEADRELGADEVLVRVVLDDRAEERVSAPRVAVSQEGVETVSLTDDGTVAGDTVADGIYMGEVVVQRTQYLTFSVLDGDDQLAELTVFLPSTGQAAISLRTNDGDPPVELAAEPAATGGTDGPGGGPSGGGGGGAVTADRVSHVLWAGVALFAIAFAWLRTVLWRLWTEEIRPVLKKHERWLDAQQSGGKEEG